MLKDLVEKYYFDQNYNCAESLLHAANEYYDLKLDEYSMKLVSGYGAGIQTGNTCGTVLSAVSILSLLFVETKAHESTDIKPVVQLFLEHFGEALNGSLLCRDLKEQYFRPEERCIDVVLTACDVLESTIAEYKNSEKADSN